MRASYQSVLRHLPLLLLMTARLSAAEYRVELRDRTQPDDALSAAVAESLAESSLVVLRGEKRTICEIWWCRQWPAADLPVGGTTSEIAYPFQPGQLVGVVRLPRKTGEFRDRDLSKGLFTLRYAQMPTDGNHEGVFPTRDFLLLVPVENDNSPEPMDVEQLTQLSAEALGASHPALFCLLKPAGNTQQLPAIRMDDDNEWTILQAQGVAVANGTPRDLRVDVVVSGHARE